MTTIDELIERCRKAEGGDRELDAEIASIVRYHPYGPFHWLDRSPEAVYAPTHAGWLGFTLPGEGTPRDAWASHEYTSSIDAITALIEKELPGWDWGAECLHEDRSYGKVWVHGWHDDTVVEDSAPTAPLALCLAFLLAIQSKETSDA